ncbi:MAG: NAD(P)-dependent malic enzyme [Nanoarchaeota archaeon]
MEYKEESIKLHKKNKGNMQICSKVNIKNKNDLSLAYTPGVAGACLEIKKDKKQAKELTFSKNCVAVISDGSAVLGLGNIGPDAAIPVMEGKSILFKEFGGINAVPVVLDTQDTKTIIETIKLISKSYGGINLEDISAPRCFEIEKILKEELDIPIFHDDQHGTAIVVLAGLINSLKIVNKKPNDIKILINGSGAAGIAITKLLHKYGFNDIIVCDSKGIVSRNRDDLNWIKKEILDITNKKNISGNLKNAIKNRDVFIGVSVANLLTQKHIQSMNKDPIIFAMANPTPEIMPDIAKQAGAKIIATGRSDFENQINNVLVFPGIFKGAFQNNIKIITKEIMINAAINLANSIENPNPTLIIPSPLTKGISDIVAKAVK